MMGNRAKVPVWCFKSIKRLEVEASLCQCMQDFTQSEELVPEAWEGSSCSLNVVILVPTHFSRLAAKLMLSWAESECPRSVWDTSSSYERNESDPSYEEPGAINTCCWNLNPSCSDSSYMIIMVDVPEMCHTHTHNNHDWYRDFCFHNGNLRVKNNDRSDINPV